MPTIHIYAIDYDGTIARKKEIPKIEEMIAKQKRNIYPQPFSPQQITELRTKLLLEYNNPLIDAIQQEVIAHPEDKHILINFSNRGSYEIDQSNRYKDEFDSGSCFDFLPELAKACGIEFDPLLMADLFAKEEPGTAYQHITDENYVGLHSSCPMDTSKVTTVLCHTQHFATLYPHAPHIFYRVYDDKCDLGILETIKNYFSKNASLLPTRVTVNLNHYAEERVSPYASFKGEGVPNPNYVSTVHALACLAAGKPLSYNWQTGDDFYATKIDASSVPMEALEEGVKTLIVSKASFFARPKTPYGISEASLEDLDLLGVD